MIEQITGSASAASPAGASAAKSDGVRLGRQFHDMLTEAMGKLSADRKEVEQLEGLFASGQLPDVHNLLIASEKAALNLELTVQIRNKVIEAYQEIMRIQI